MLSWLTLIAIWTIWVLVRRGFGGLAEEVETRSGNIVTVVMLILVVAAAWSAFARELFRPQGNERVRRSTAFALLALGGGLLLILGPELFFIDDVNDFRPNTVFKLWFQAWMLLSVGGAFGLYYLTRSWRLKELISRSRPRQTAARLGWAAVTVVVIGAALVYTVTATMERTGGFGNEQRVDGYVNIQDAHPGEYEALRWLNDNVKGIPVLLEAVDASYGDGARISARTGIPTVLGWPRHETLWGRPDELVASREKDVRRIYESDDSEEARRLLQEHDVEYVYVGWLERAQYDIGREDLDRFDRFAEFMDVVFQNDEVTIYRLREPDAAAVRGSP